MVWRDKEAGNTAGSRHLDKFTKRAGNTAGSCSSCRVTFQPTTCSQLPSSWRRGSSRAIFRTPAKVRPNRRPVRTLDRTDDRKSPTSCRRTPTPTPVSGLAPVAEPVHGWWTWWCLFPEYGIPAPGFWALALPNIERLKLIFSIAQIDWSQIYIFSRFLRPRVEPGIFRFSFILPQLQCPRPIYY